jgi:hypothetical protein
MLCNLEFLQKQKMTIFCDCSSANYVGWFCGELANGIC